MNGFVFVLSRLVFSVMLQMSQQARDELVSRLQREVADLKRVVSQLEGENNKLKDELTLQLVKHKEEVIISVLFLFETLIILRSFCLKILHFFAFRIV